MDFLDKLRKIIRQHQLFPEKAKILIAVSGGIDSVTLLDCLVQLKEEFQLILATIHLNHGIRGDEANRDQSFVEELSHQYQLTCFSQKVDTPAYVQLNKCSMEQGARNLRYQFFSEQLIKNRYNFVAVGHNANDQVETLIDHFLRGSGVRGLAGMAIKRDYVIRPLLYFSRLEIEKYAQQQGLKYVTDSTNRDVIYKRNRIRHTLIPELQRHFNPSLIQSLTKTSDIIRQHEQFLEAETEKAFQDCVTICKKNKIVLDIDRFFNYFTIIKIYLLNYSLELLSQKNQYLNFTSMNAILDQLAHRKIGARFPMAAGYELMIDHDGLVIYRLQKHEFEIEFQPGKVIELYNGEYLLKSEIIPRTELPKSFPLDRKIEYFDFEKMTASFKIRNVLPGDKFIPLNMTGEKKISDFFTDNKIPLHLRKRIPVLTCLYGIVWLIGCQIDDRYKISETSTIILKTELIEVNDEKR
jgi:tRNA(Ile)-lysidine synthase